MRRPISSALFAILLALAWSPSAWAQQSVSFFIGEFTPRSMDGRGVTDVLFQNGGFLSTLNQANGIDINQFNNVTVGGEYLVGLGQYFEGGLGLGFYERTVPTVYTSLVNQDGSDIAQNLSLRIVPFSATVRVLPFGHRAPVQPYVGGGVGVFIWRYSESGQFVDANSNVFNGIFTASGTEVGPIVFGGVRFPMGPFGVGGEIRWQDAKANLPASQGFAGSTIDLGGFNYLFTMNFRF